MYDLLNAPDNKKEITPNYRPLIIWSVLIGTGMLFRVQHWPGSSLLIILSTAGIAAYSISKTILIYKTRNILFLAVSAISVCWTILLFSGGLFNPYHLDAIKIYLTGFFIFSVIYSSINLIKLNKQKQSAE